MEDRVGPIAEWEERMDSCLDVLRCVEKRRPSSWRPRNALAETKKHPSIIQQVASEVARWEKTWEESHFEGRIAGEGEERGDISYGAEKEQF